MFRSYLPSEQHDYFIFSLQSFPDKTKNCIVVSFFPFIYPKKISNQSHHLLFILGI